MATLSIQDNIFAHMLVRISGGDVFKLALSNVAIPTTVATLAGITEIATGGGYVAGGFTVSASVSNPTSRSAAAAFADYAITATGTMATFQYGLIYNSSDANRAWFTFNLGGPVSLTAGSQHPLDFQTAAVTVS